MTYRKIILISVFAVQFVFSGICGDADMAVSARASNGHGMLCKSQDKRILILSGNPEQIGTAHGELMKKDIGEDSIVGSGSVVVKSIPAYSFAVGIPAKVIRRRNMATGAQLP